MTVEVGAVKKRVQYRGNLAQTTLPEMLFSIDRFRVPGVIEAVSGAIRKRVYLEDGYVIHASSSDLNDSLGYHLLRSGKLSRDAFTITMQERQNTSKRYGVLLIERGLLSPAEVHEAIQGQIEGIVWSLFGWQQGEVTFELGERRDSEMVHIQIPMRRVIVQGIKRAPDPKVLIARLGKKDTVLEPSFEVEDLIELGLDAEEYRLLTLVDGNKTVYELCAAGPRSPADNGKLLYAFQVLKLVEVREPGREAEPPRPIKIRLKTEGDRFES